LKLKDPSGRGEGKGKKEMGGRCRGARFGMMETMGRKGAAGWGAGGKPNDT